MEPEQATKYGLQLSLCGLYYQGFVDDDEAVFTQHKMETVNLYRVRRSRQNSARLAANADPHPVPMDDEENLLDNIDCCKNGKDKREQN